MPTIGIDASRMVGDVRTGTENYADQIIRGLIADPVPWTWCLYFNGNATDADVPELDNVEIRDIPSSRLWTHRRLSGEMMRRRPDGLFVPSHVIPLVHPPSVVTIHDLGYLRVPESHPQRQRLMLDLTTRWSARAARHVIVPSERTRDDLIELYRTPPSKITVIHHGVHPRFAASRDHADPSLRRRYRLNRDYVLAVGTVQPRKDLPLLARAIARSGIDHDLVIAGKLGWMAADVLQELDAAGLGDRLRLLDYVPDDDLPSLYQNATVMAQPSRFEGFGMPVLEAMASGTPVIAANGSSLAEICGDAALLFEPGEVDDLASRLRAITGEARLREEYRARGIGRAGYFTWEHAARKTRNLLEKAILRAR